MCDHDTNGMAMNCCLRRGWHGANSRAQVDSSGPVSLLATTLRPRGLLWLCNSWCFLGDFSVCLGPLHSFLPNSYVPLSLPRALRGGCSRPVVGNDDSVQVARQPGVCLLVDAILNSTRFQSQKCARVGDSYTVILLMSQTYNLCFRFLFEGIEDMPLSGLGPAGPLCAPSLKARGAAPLPVASGSQTETCPEAGPGLWGGSLCAHSDGCDHGEPVSRV